MAFALPTPASTGPLLFQPTLSLAARRAQSKAGLPTSSAPPAGPLLSPPSSSAAAGPFTFPAVASSTKKKPALALTLDLSDIPPKTIDRDPDSGLPIGRNNSPPQLPSESELAQMTPQTRITAENTVFNWALGKKKFDAHGHELPPSALPSGRAGPVAPVAVGGYGYGGFDEDDAGSVVSLTHSSNSGSAASSSVPTPLTGRSLLEDGNFSAPHLGAQHQCTPHPLIHQQHSPQQFQLQPQPQPQVQHPKHQQAVSGPGPSPDLGRFASPGRRTSNSSLKSSSSASRAGRNVAFVCLANKHVVAPGESAAECSCRECDCGSPVS